MSFNSSSKNSEVNLHKDYINRHHFGNLDGLRFICILMVLWHHYQVVDFNGADILDRGFMGVDFFFVLSGYLITTLLLREESRYGNFSLKNFYVRRILRIVPVYFFVVTMVSLYYVVVKGQHELTELVPFYYLFLSNFLIDHIPLLSVTWSLSVEEQYYMLWPLLLILLPRRWMLYTLFALITLNVLSGFNFFEIKALEAGPLEFNMPNATYAPMLMGSFSAILLHKQGGFVKIAAVLSHNLAVPVLFIILALVLHLAPADVRGLPNLTIHTLMTISLMALVIKEKNILAFFFKFPPIARIGAVSYGIYLYHLISLDISTRIFKMLGIANPWILFVIYIFASWIMAEISYRTLETFFQRFRPQRGTSAPKPVETTN